jgi:hypothetical protein
MILLGYLKAELQKKPLVGTVITSR